MKRGGLVLLALAGCDLGPAVHGNWHYENGGATAFNFNLVIRAAATEGKLDVLGGLCTFTATKDSDRSGHVDAPQTCTLDMPGQAFTFVTYDGSPPLGGWRTVVVDSLTFAVDPNDALVTEIVLSDGAATPRTAKLTPAKGSRR